MKNSNTRSKNGSKNAGNGINKRFLLLAAILALVLAFAAGCTDADNPGVSVGNSGNSPVVATINGINVYADNVGFMVRQTEEMLAWEYFEMFGDFEIDHEREFRDGLTFGRVLREESARAAAFTVLYLDYAVRMGLTVSAEDIDMLNEHIDSLTEQVGEEELLEMLMGDGIRDRGHLLEIYKSQILLENLLNAITSDPDEFAKFEAHMPEDSSVEVYNKANEILTRALAGEDFDMLIETYGEDPGMASNPNGYTFTSGVMVSEFEEATIGLEIGEISGLVQSQFGFHIIKRVEPDPENVMRGPLSDEDDELLAAKHILLQVDGRSEEDRMMEAIYLGFTAMFEEAEIVFLPALDDLNIER